MVSKLFNTRLATSMEVTIISIVFFCLPLLEAPKNFFSVLFFIVWGVCAVRGGKLGRSSPFDVPVFGLALILWVAPLFSHFGDIITPLNSAPRWTLLALFVLAASRLDYSCKQVTVLWAALILGGIVAVTESFWVWSFNGRTYPEFRSVGHVNHSSMYSLVVLAAGLGTLWMRKTSLRGLGAIALISSFAFLPPSRSLVGGGSIVILLLFSIGIWAVSRRSLRGFVVGVSSVVLVSAAVLMTPPAAAFRAELVMRVSGNEFFSNRDNILNSALAVWDRHPLLGTGWFSFGMATSEVEVRAALAADGLEYDTANYVHLPHGHNLWTTMLIERGLLGVGLVTALLFLYFKIFLPIALSRQQIDPMDRGVATTGLFIAVGFAVAGLANTTMMNEHGHAGMALIAVSYGYLRGRGLLGSTSYSCLAHNA